jgi:hypothetical protein
MKTIANAGKKNLHPHKKGYKKHEKLSDCGYRRVFLTISHTAWIFSKMLVTHPGRNILVDTRQLISIHTTIQTIHSCDII